MRARLACQESCHDVIIDKNQSDKAYKVNTDELFLGLKGLRSREWFINLIHLGPFLVSVNSTQSGRSLYTHFIPFYSYIHIL